MSAALLSTLSHAERKSIRASVAPGTPLAPAEVGTRRTAPLDFGMMPRRLLLNLPTLP